LRAQTRFRLYRGRRVPFLFFCAPRLVFGGTEGVGSRFHELRARTRFRPYQRRRVQFTCFALPDSFSAVTRASGPVSMFCAPALVFCSTEGVGSHFHVLQARTHFLRYRGRRVPFSCFARPGWCLGLGRGVGGDFHFLRSRTRFLQYRGRRVPFTCFALPESFSTVTRAWGPIFMFCVPTLIFCGTEDVGSRFHVLRARTYFLRYRGRRVPFSCFARPNSFSAVPRASGPVFIFFARPDSFSAVPRRLVPF
jgi:hypothetical protein